MRGTHFPGDVLRGRGASYHSRITSHLGGLADSITLRRITKLAPKMAEVRAAVRTAPTALTEGRRFDVLQ